MQSSISKYRITKRVGGGSFGDIYLGVGANGEKVRRVGWRFFPGRSIGHGERRGKIERVSPVHRFPVNSIVRKLSWGTPKKITCNYDMNLRGASAADTEGIAKSYGRICRTKFSLMDPTGGVPGSCGVGGRTSCVILLANETRSLRPPSLFLGVPSAEGCVGWTMTALGGDLCLVMNHVLCCGSFILKRGWALQGGKSLWRNYAHFGDFSPTIHSHRFCSLTLFVLCCFAPHLLSLSRYPHLRLPSNSKSMAPAARSSDTSTRCTESCKMPRASPRSTTLAPRTRTTSW